MKKMNAHLSVKQSFISINEKKYKKKRRNVFQNKNYDLNLRRF